MNRITKKMKKDKEVLRELLGEEKLERNLEEMLSEGKRALDGAIQEIGQIFIETLLIMDREEISGEDYRPVNKDLDKWGFQKGSVYVGQEKIRISHPRLRNNGKEVPLRLYDRLKQRDVFSQEMLSKAMRGLSGRKYRETVSELAQGFGLSASSISNRYVEASLKKLKEFQERDLSDFMAFAIFLDTIHRGGVAFTIALGIDKKGKKKALGLWEGSTENHEMVKSLLSDLESRALY